jgi:hypothetical protein
LLTFEQTDQVSLGSLLQGSDGSRLEAEIGFEVLGNLANKALERKLADQQLSALLVATDLTQSNCSWTIAMGLLDSTLIEYVKP